MKVFRTPYIYILFLTLTQATIFSQEKTLSISSDIQEERLVLSQLEYEKNQPNDSLAQQEVERIRQYLIQRGYLDLKWQDWSVSDSVYHATFHLGQRIEEIQLSLDSLPEKWRSEIRKTPTLRKTKTTILLPFEQLPSFMQGITEKLHQSGHPFAEVKLGHIELSEGKAEASLIITESGPRTIDKIVIRGYEDFPLSFMEHHLKLKPGSTYSLQKLERASRSINNLDFAEEAKPPEVLFTEDSTIIFMYLRKRKANALDGLIGFASESDGDGLELNGYLDLQVRNLFNGGESLNLYWKSNGNDRQRFFLDVATPYLFKTPIIPRVKMEIYRQDSTYSNVAFQARLGYSISNRIMASAIFNTEKSNDLSKTATGISSYQNYFAGVSIGYRIPAEDRLFPVGFELRSDLSLGSRKREERTTGQSKILMGASYLLPLGQNHYLHFANHSAALFSEDFLENELFRIGGINNLRGVNEESIFASLYSIFNLEYRYKTTARSYFFTITDAAYVENRSISENTRILSLGFGYSFTTIMGRVSFSYANGKFSNSPFNLDNSKVHVKIINHF